MNCEIIPCQYGTFSHLNRSGGGYVKPATYQGAGNSWAFFLLVAHVQIFSQKLLLANGAFEGGENGPLLSRIGWGVKGKIWYLKEI